MRALFRIFVILMLVALPPGGAGCRKVKYQGSASADFDQPGDDFPSGDQPDDDDGGADDGGWPDPGDGFDDGGDDYQDDFDDYVDDDFEF